MMVVLLFWRGHNVNQPVNVKVMPGELASSERINTLTYIMLLIHIIYFPNLFVRRNILILRLISPPSYTRHLA